MATDTERLLHEARAHLTDLHQDLAVAVGVAKTPDDEALTRIDAAIEAQRTKVQRLERMVAAGKVHATAEAIKAGKVKRQEAYAKAVKIAKGRVELARKLDDAFAALAPLLKEWEKQGIECHANAADVNRGFDWQYGLLAAARGNDSRLAGALDWAMHSIGLGTVGIYSDINVRKPIGMDFYSIEQAAEATAQKLAATLENAKRIADLKAEEI